MNKNVVLKRSLSTEHLVFVALFVVAVYGLFSGSSIHEFTGAQVATLPQTFSTQWIDETLFTGDTNRNIESKGSYSLSQDWTIDFDMWSDAVENYRNPFDANFVTTGSNVGPRFEQYNDGTFKLVIGKGTGTPLSALTYGTITASRWYHITALKQGNTILTYLDGVKKTEETSTTGYTTNFANIIIGKGYSNNGERWFKGRIKNVILLNKAQQPDLDILGPITAETIVTNIAHVGKDQGTIAFRLTPFWNLEDNSRHGLFQSGANIWANDNNRITIVKWNDNNLYFRRVGSDVFTSGNDLKLSPAEIVGTTGKKVQDFFKNGQAVDVDWLWYTETGSNIRKMNVSLNGYLAKSVTYTGKQPAIVEPIARFGIGHNGPQWPGTLGGTLTNMKLSMEPKIPASNLGIPKESPIPPVSNPRLLLHFKFEDTVDNSIMNGAPLPQPLGTFNYNPGAVGKAAEFSGTNALYVGNIGSVITPQWTIEFFMRSTDVSNYRNPMDFNFKEGTGNRGPRFEQSNDGQFKFVIGHDGTGDNYLNPAPLIQPIVPKNTWEHIAIVKSGTNLKIYVNGQITQDTSLIFNGVNYFPRALSSLIIGQGYNNDANRYFKGQLDEIKIYNYARDQAGIQQDCQESPLNLCGVATGAKVIILAPPTAATATIVGQKVTSTIRVENGAGCTPTIAWGFPAMGFVLTELKVSCTQSGGECYTASYAYSAAGTYQLKAKCGESFSDIVTYSIQPTPSGFNKPVIVTINPSTIFRGQSSTLSWQDLRGSVTSCSINGPGIPVGTTSTFARGNIPVTPSDTSSYLVSCSGAGLPAVMSGSGIVTIAPTPLLNLVITSQPIIPPNSMTTITFAPALAGYNIRYWFDTEASTTNPWVSASDGKFTIQTPAAGTHTLHVELLDALGKSLSSAVQVDQTVTVGIPSCTDEDFICSDYFVCKKNNQETRTCIKSSRTCVDNPSVVKPNLNRQTMKETQGCSHNCPIGKKCFETGLTSLGVPGSLMGLGLQVCALRGDDYATTAQQGTLGAGPGSMVNFGRCGGIVRIYEPATSNSITFDWKNQRYLGPGRFNGLIKDFNGQLQPATGPYTGFQPGGLLTFDDGPDPKFIRKPYLNCFGGGAPKSGGQVDCPQNKGEPPRLGQEGFTINAGGVCIMSASGAHLALYGIPSQGTAPKITSCPQTQADLDKVAVKVGAIFATRDFPNEEQTRTGFTDGTCCVTLVPEGSPFIPCNVDNLWSVTPWSVCSNGKQTRTVTLKSGVDLNNPGCSNPYDVKPIEEITCGVRVTLNYPSDIIGVGNSISFSAIVSGTANNAITWRSSSGSITSAGIFTPSGVGSVTITGTSVADSSRTATATINVVNPNLFVTGPATVSQGAEEQIKLVITNAPRDYTIKITVDGIVQTNAVFSIDTGTPNWFYYSLKTLTAGSHIITFQLTTFGGESLGQPATHQIIIQKESLQSSTDITTGLIGYWPLQTNINDLSTSGNNGRIVGTVPLATTGGYSFTPKNFIRLPNGGGLEGLSSGTVSLIAQWTGNQCQSHGLYGSVFARQYNNQYSNNIIGLSLGDLSTATVTWRPFNGQIPGLIGTTVVGSTPHHITVTFISGNHKLYIDGKLDGNLDLRGSLASEPDSDLTIGAWIDDGDCYSTSTVKEVRTYNRQLNNCEVRQLCIASGFTNCPSSC